jgi:hypothetical protein
MKIENIKIGDVLFSKEYNCKVTIEAITTNNRIVVVWIDKEGKPHRELVSPNNLES